MGDMADLALESVDQMEMLRTEYHMGLMTQEEAYELGIIDEMGVEITSTYQQNRN